MIQIIKNSLKRVLAGFSAIVLTAVQISNPDPTLFVSFSDNSVKGVLTFAILNVILPLTGIVAVLFVIIGGYQYMASGANEEMAEQGKKTLQNAITGLVVVILSYVIVNVIINTVSQAGS